MALPQLLPDTVTVAVVVRSLAIAVVMTRRLARGAAVAAVNGAVVVAVSVASSEWSRQPVLH